MCPCRTLRSLFNSGQPHRYYYLSHVCFRQGCLLHRRQFRCKTRDSSFGSKADLCTAAKNCSSFGHLIGGEHSCPQAWTGRAAPVSILVCFIFITPPLIRRQQARANRTNLVNPRIRRIIKYGGWAVGRDGPMDSFIPSEHLSGVEQLQRSAVIATQNVARLRSELENEPDEFTRSRLLKLLLLEAEKSLVTRQQLDRIDCHMAELRELTYRQVELVEKGKLKGQLVERAAKLLALLNDLMTNYQTLRRRISPLAE